MFYFVHVYFLLNPTSEVKRMKVAQSFATPRTIQSMEFSRPEYWSGEPFLSPGDLPDPGIKPGSPALQMGSLPTELSGKHIKVVEICFGNNFLETM